EGGQELLLDLLAGRGYPAGDVAHDIGIGVQVHQVVHISQAEPPQHQPVRLEENLHRPVLPTPPRYGAGLPGDQFLRHLRAPIKLVNGCQAPSALVPGVDLWPTTGMPGKAKSRSAYWACPSGTLDLTPDRTKSRNASWASRLTRSAPVEPTARGSFPWPIPSGRPGDGCAAVGWVLTPRTKTSHRAAPGPAKACSRQGLTRPYRLSLLSIVVVID